MNENNNMNNDYTNNPAPAEPAENLYQEASAQTPQEPAISSQAVSRITMQMLTRLTRLPDSSRHTAKQSLPWFWESQDWFAAASAV